MTDSPLPRIPLDPKEQPILDKLQSIRTQLQLLKRDRSTYFKSQDVLSLYDQVIEQVKILNEIRVTKRLEQNKVDYMLDDCFQLISLAYLTVGKNHEPPAVYSYVSTIKRLLDHLKEATFYSPKDLEALDKNLQDCRRYVERGRDEHTPHLLTLLNARIQVCEETLSELKLNLSGLTPELTPKWDRLVSILRCLAGCNARSKFPLDEVNEYEIELNRLQEELKEYDIYAYETTGTTEEKLAEMVGKMQLVAAHPEPAPEAKTLIGTLLRRNLLWVALIKQKQGRIAPAFQDTYDKLLAIRNKLEKLTLTQAWSLRETDLWDFQRQLDRVDEARVDGNFIDAVGRPSEIYEQRTLLYLLRKSYSLIYQLLLTSEPVSEALLPIYNQLTTLRKCLQEVKNLGGVSSPRELYPYSMKLNSIDNMRVDGKFMVGDEIPDGQGRVTQLLEDCFELAYDLRNDAENSSSEEATPQSETPNEPVVA
ncbi:Nn.00g064720.m01.CDS01 [Neocucurbitaria sp. VM-36]